MIRQLRLCLPNRYLVVVADSSYAVLELLVCAAGLREPLNGLSCEGRVEVTLHEVRTHLGVETQRQWSDLAILRITPSLLGLFSLVTLFAHQSLQGQPLLVRKAAWYAKTLFCMSPSKPDMVEILRTLFERLTETLAFAA